MTTSSISLITSSRDAQSTWASKLNKCFYQAEQQLKFMDLQAEVDCLLKQLQEMKIQRLVTITSSKE